MAKKAEAASSKVGAKVKKGDMVTVYGTGENKGMPAGSSHLIHQIHAEKLVAKGFASYDKIDKVTGKVSKKDKKAGEGEGE
jgi:hypothetical protein